jgi:hypothetical protein
MAAIAHGLEGTVPEVTALRDGRDVIDHVRQFVALDA